MVKVNIQVTERGITLDQSVHTEGIVVERMGSTDLRRFLIPSDPGMELSARRSDEEGLDLSQYVHAKISGKLILLAGMAQQDISSNICDFSRRTSSPCMQYWRGLQHLLRYLSGPIDVSIQYRRSNIDSKEGTSMLVGYSEADWIGDMESTLSATGYLLSAYGSPLAWESNFQQSVSRSTLESEWTGKVRVTRHGLFLKGILVELQFPEVRMQWFCDNHGAIQSAYKIEFWGTTKHVDIKSIANDFVGMEYVT